ncbi:hypothetical protein CHCC14819_0761 [Bacillus licheniformis]|nr:hypothetical protein CHCC20442_0192 [Bacillus licheniformis]TWK52352.1 hypothetical protein CHCC20344_2493 [Bacillus licheniformis]TWK67010.1 hypothetical protein CHCC20341_2442 [Bacillus licheniformis]TWM20215.1 hypothetical protein CHCC15087_4077 [Bacillus licheniformis]TWM31575.1 hypothetical protein CHCC14819_0761 [Bacillus licheniformis]
MRDGEWHSKNTKKEGSVASASETRYNSFTIQDEVRILPKSVKQSS